MEIVPWSEETEVDAVRGFDAGVMPLSDDPWSRGKSATKLLQYMACGIPCIATPFGAVLEFLRDGENGLFADTPEEWRDALERLRDPALRKRLGQAGRTTVEERYSLGWAAPRMHSALESVA